MKKFLPLYISICVVWIFFAQLYAQATPGTGILMVHVSDASTQQPIQGAKVTVKDTNGTKVTKGTTDGSGVVSLTLEAGGYLIRGKAKGYQKSEEFFATVFSGSTNHWYIPLVRD